MSAPRLRVALVDDEPLARQGARAQCLRHADVEPVGDYADAASARLGLAQAPADLLLLDVQMPGETGLDLLDSLPAADRPLVILLTAHEAFAVRAFALGAVDYLLKPLDPERFDEALARARERLALRRQAGALATPEFVARFAVKLGRRTLFVPTTAIEWIEADGDYARLHAGGRSYLLREPLADLAGRLDPSRFVRVHRSAIVRVDQVAELQPLSNRDALLRLRDGSPVRASRTYMDALLAHLAGCITRD